MSVGIETKVFRALTDRLDAFVIANPIAVAYPARDFSPPAETPYLRISWLPARTDPVAIKRTNEYSGIFQVDVFWPDNKGLIKPLEFAALLVAHYVRGTTLFREGIKVRVHRPPSVAPAMQEPGWVQVPVSIPYQAFVRS